MKTNKILAQAIVRGVFEDPLRASKLLLSLPSNPLIYRLFFSQIKNPNIYAWNIMIRCECQSASYHDVLSLYSLMRQEGLLPDTFTFPFVLKACGKLLSANKGAKLHCLSIKIGFEFDTFVQNSLIFMYSLCNMIKTARRVFDFAPVFVRDIISWNTMLSGYLQMENYKEALKLFGKMIRCSVTFDSVTTVCALNASAKIRDLNLGKKIHAFVVKNGFAVDVFLGSSLIDMYAKGGEVDVARQLFDKMPEKNVVCWTSMISGYTHSNGFKESIELFRKMQMTSIKADEATLTCVISACGHLGLIDQGRWLHAYCDRNNFRKNISINCSLMDMYSKCGDIERALKIFHELERRDVYSWTAIISGLAMNGKTQEALDLFSQMELSNDVKPNSVTFLGVLNACTHGGLVKEGYKYLELMSRKYNITPQIEHYGCIVDLLGRAGRLTEAENFIRNMPIDPDEVIWRSLLFACCRVGNLELAEVVAKEALKLDPRKCGTHVLLSNIYAESYRWSDVKRVRKGMDVYGIRKQPGCSYIEINGGVHEFLALDRSHPENKKVYEVISSMNKTLNAEGYIPIVSHTEDFLAVAVTQ